MALEADTSTSTKTDPEYIVLEKTKQNCIQAILDSCNVLSFIGLDETNEAELTIFMRILHISNAVLRDDQTKIHTFDYIKQIMKTHIYKSPWDKDNLTYYSLKNICSYLQENMPDNSNIYNACNESLDPVNLLTEIKNIYALASGIAHH